MIDRRTFLAGTGAVLLATPLATEAQQAAKVARIGFLALNLAPNRHLHEAFRQGLRDLGYVEGRNVEIEYRDAKGKDERLPALAAELVALKVDVMVAGAVARRGPCHGYQGMASPPIVDPEAIVRLSFHPSRL